MRKPTSWGLLGLVVLTIIIGFYLRNESSYGTRVVYPFRADARDYYMYAYNLRHSQTYSKDITSLSDSRHSVSPDAVRSPGYPLFLSIFVDGPPDNRTFATIVFAQMLLSNLVLVLAFSFYNRFLSEVLFPQQKVPCAGRLCRMPMKRNSNGLWSFRLW